MFALFLRRFESLLVEQAVEAAEVVVEAEVARQQPEVLEVVASSHLTCLNIETECPELWGFGLLISLPGNTGRFLVGITPSAKVLIQRRCVRHSAYAVLRFLARNKPED